MGNSLYTINKGINKSIEFKGLKAQYIGWLGGGLVGLLILFALLYILGLNTFLCLGVILMLGAGWFMYVYKLSNTYGEHGMMKKMAQRRIPKRVQSNSRRLFIRLAGKKGSKKIVVDVEHRRRRQ